MERWRLLLIPLFILGMVMYMLSFHSGEESFLQKRREKNITFLSGGVSERERENLQEMGKKYSLKLMFSKKKGEYLSDVTVKILDQMDKTILTTVSNGPWFFINLPSGTYDLEVSFQKNRKRISQVKVEEKSQTVIGVQW